MFRFATPAIQTELHNLSGDGDHPAELFNNHIYTAREGKASPLANSFFRRREDSGFVEKYRTDLSPQPIGSVRAWQGVIQ